MTLDEQKPKVSVQETRAAVAERIASLGSDGRDTIRLSDLADLIGKGLRSRAWFRTELLRLVREGWLVDEGDGQFRIVPEGEGPEGMATCILDPTLIEAAAPIGAGAEGDHS